MALCTAVLMAVLLFGPDQWFDHMNVDWLFGCFLFPVLIPFGMLSAWLYRRNHPEASLDPTYIRAWWSLTSGLVVLPICLIFRPALAHLAFISFTFGLGPVVGFQLFRYFTKPKLA